MRIVTQQQYDDEYWAARRGVPTCSEFGRICTPANGEYGKGARSYINELIGELYNPNYGIYSTYQSAAMRQGHVIEPRARRFFEFEMGVTVRQVGFCLDGSGRFGGSPDALIGDDETGGVLELKGPDHKTQVAYLLDGKLPADYRGQCHGHLIVSGRPYTQFYSYAEGLPTLSIRVEPDTYTAKMRENLERFWADYQGALKKIADVIGPPPCHTVPEAEDVVLF